MRIQSENLVALIKTLRNIDPTIDPFLDQNDLLSPRDGHTAGICPQTFAAWQIALHRTEYEPGDEKFIELTGWRIHRIPDCRNLCLHTDDDCSYLYEAANDWGDLYEYFWYAS